MEKRQAQLLKLVVEEYIRTALPIGSSQIEEMGVLDVSAATIRNELRDLEEFGYLTHPHTSAGRIPTEMGYEYYLTHLVEESRLPKAHQEEIVRLEASFDGEQKMKELAKYIAEVGDGAVLVAFDPHRIYYTGISYLFAAPEFHNVAHTIKVSSLFDHCEEHIQEFFDRVLDTEMKVFIGEQNPMGSMCSAVAVRLGESLFVLVCPMRMDYRKNIAILDFIKKLF
jgi:transcriptional regulator of heat shock response